MSSQAGGSSTYRNTRVQDDSDDEDLDDLDDVLAAFDAKKPATTQQLSPPNAASGSRQAAASSNATAAPVGSTLDDEEDFEASLAGEMELLLKQLAGTHLPGPMPDQASSGPAGNAQAATEAGGGVDGLSSAEEEAAWQKAIEMMLSGEGLEAMGLDKQAASGGPGPSATAGPSTQPRAPSTAPPAKPPTFDETIRRTMEQLNSKDKGRAGSAAGGADGVPPELAALLAKLSGDGLGEDGEDDDIGGLLDGMMSQLMTKEVLEEPMAELASKYPDYLANPPSDVSAADLEKYRQQHKLVDQIVTMFRKPGYSDETDGKEIARLVSEMQDLGGPPKEIMGDLPEGLDLAGLGGDDACIVM